MYCDQTTSNGVGMVLISRSGRGLGCTSVTPSPILLPRNSSEDEGNYNYLGVARRRARLGDLRSQNWQVRGIFPGTLEE